MPDTIHLANGSSINLDDALGTCTNVVVRKAQFNALVQMSMRLWEQRLAASALVATHIGVAPECVEMERVTAWKRGGFNLVVPMVVKGTKPDTAAERVFLRIPLPAKLGEEQHPGSVADKLRCETASYIYMQRHCPELRIPHLYGFGFPSMDGVKHTHFSHASRLSVFRRAVLYVRQLVATWLRWPVPSSYLPISLPAEPIPPPLADTGYLVIENLDEARFGKRLPFIVPFDRPFHVHFAEEPVKTRTLCGDLSRIMLSLARIPQPRIGAFRFCLEDGTIRLDGRPVHCDLAILESEGTPRTIGLDTTYTSATRYVSELLRFQDAALRAGPNIAQYNGQAEEEMAVRVMLRAVAHQFVGNDDDGEGGDACPYILHLSDNNPGNILVDEDWHITGLFDLEWLFATPVAQLGAPLWLTWKGIDEIAMDDYDEYCASRRVYMDIFREEERKQRGSDATSLSDAIDASWTSQRTWFYSCLTSVDAMAPIFKGRLQPLFWPAQPDTDADTDVNADADTSADADTDKKKAPATTPPHDALYRLWQPGAEAVVAQKQRDREEHEAAIKRLFEDRK